MTPSRSRKFGGERRIAEKLQAMGIHTVQQLRRQSPRSIRTQFRVVMVRTVAELQGISRIDIEDVPPPKKLTLSSKSFGAMVGTIAELGKALSNYVVRVAEKLPAQHW